MSDELNVTENQDGLPSELDLLKQRADQLGVSYHPNIGLEKLREKVTAALESSSPEEPEVVTAPAVAAAPTVAEQRLAVKQEATKLVRVRVACMNPNKKEWTGEIFTVSNKVVGTLRKFVPFNQEWHVPAMILRMLKRRQCQIFVNSVDRLGNKIRSGKLINEFAVEELPPLSEAELHDLAQRQAMAAGTTEI